MQKLGQVDAWPRSCDLLWNFGIPSISREWVKLKTSNVLCRFIVRCTKQTMQKWIQRA